MKKLLTALVITLILSGCDTIINQNTLRWATESCALHDGVDYYKAPGVTVEQVMCNDGTNVDRVTRR